MSFAFLLFALVAAVNPCRLRLVLPERRGASLGVRCPLGAVAAIAAVGGALPGRARHQPGELPAGRRARARPRGRAGSRARPARSRARARRAQGGRSSRSPSRSCSPRESSARRRRRWRRRRDRGRRGARRRLRARPRRNARPPRGAGRRATRRRRPAARARSRSRRVALAVDALESATSERSPTGPRSTLVAMGRNPSRGGTGVTRSSQTPAEESDVTPPSGARLDPGERHRGAA